MTHADSSLTLSPRGKPDEGRAARLRAATRREHQQAETRSFITSLMGGELDLKAYSAYLAQYAHVYQALESVSVSALGDGPLAAKELARMDAIETDLRELGVTDWRVSHPPLEATTEYVQRLRSISSDDVPRFVAHHYTRYLGDLSGGQAIAALVARHYGATDSQLGFYRFEGITHHVHFKKAYREALDALDFTPAQDEELIVEAQEAFRLNSTLFDALDARVGAREY